MPQSELLFEMITSSDFECQLLAVSILYTVAETHVEQGMTLSRMPHSSHVSYSHLYVASDWPLLQSHIGTLITILRQPNCAPDLQRTTLQLLAALSHHGTERCSLPSFLRSLLACMLACLLARLMLGFVGCLPECYRSAIIQAGALELLLSMLSSESLQVPAMETINRLAHDGRCTSWLVICS